MLFVVGVFSPELIADLRVRKVLADAAEQAGEMVCGCDVVLGAIRQGDDTLQQVLLRSARVGATAGDMLAGAVSVGNGRAGRRGRESFTAEALRALDEFEAVLEDSGAHRNGTGLELLLTCVLRHLSEQDRRALPFLDTELAASLLKEQLVRRGGGEKPSRAEGNAVVLSDECPPAEDLTDRARTAGSAPAFPFDGNPQCEALFDAIAQVLHRQQTHHVLLVGERGVGKSTVVAELARRAAAGQIPFLAGKRFLMVDCRFVPPDESRQRLVALSNDVAGRAELVVCVDGFASLLRGDRPAGNKAVLFSALSQSRCQVVGLLTPREFEEFVSDDPDFAEFFERVDVAEPDPEVALRVLRHFALGLSAKFGVAIDDEAVRQAVTLSANYILNDQLPAKALKILHRVCEEADYAASQRGQPRDRVTVDDVFRVVSAWSGVPEETLRGIAERSDYEQSLREVIFGQNHAVAAVATELGLIKAGMTDPSKPASVMMFLGQTGTGKTEMAKALARFYSTSKRLRTYTLGNCVEPHSVATIIGVPPGYVGHDQGGRLVNDLNADPYCVFLLDEADKAHPDVLQPFLNLFDEGWVCDQRGAKAYASKSIFILTSNVGQRMIAEMVEQGKSPEEISDRMKEALSQIRHTKSDRPVFTPEFLARIKRIIVFRPLDAAAMEGISRKLIGEMQQAWQAKRSKRLEISEGIIKAIAEHGHKINEKSKGKEGGRIIRKLISDWIEARIQREITLKSDEYKRSQGMALELVANSTPATEDVPAVPEIRFAFVSK